MTFFLNVELQGTSEILNELGKIENRFRTAAIGEMKAALGPMVQGAQNFVPRRPPVSGMARGYFMWDDGADQRDSIRAKVNERRKGETNRLASLWFSDQAGALFDMAGKGNGNTEEGRRLIAGITKRYGPPSRVMWRANAVYFRLTEQALLKARANMEQTLNELLGR